MKTKGIKTPDLTTEIFNLLTNDLSLNVVDTSYHHDEADSLKIDNQFLLFIPSGDNAPNYVFVEIFIDEDDDLDWDNEVVRKSKEEIIVEIKKRLKRP